MRNTILGLVLACVAASSTVAHAQCEGDIVQDGRVDGADLGVLLAYWGPRIGNTWSNASDLNQDDQVNADDLGILLAKWGGCPPVVMTVVPNTGGLSGGTSVTITGNFFAGATSVRFGGTPATAFTVVSASQINAVTPPGAPGSVNVEVRGPQGTTALTSGFTYVTTAVPTWATLIESLPDPAVVTDPVLRQRIINTGLAWRVRDTRTQIEMVLIPPGTFQMGCSASINYGCSSDESPVHPVTLTTAFYLGRYEVTQQQWRVEMGYNPSFFQGPDFPQATHPVDAVSWNVIQNFNFQTGMRLPTEAEWEYAYRAGTITAFHGFTGYLTGTNSDALVAQIGWTSSNSGGFPKAIGQKLANGFGLYDMSGNAFEWVNDRYSSTYYSTGPATDPPGPASGSDRVFRGGSWSENTGKARSSSRSRVNSGNVYSDLGFRVARNP